METRTLLLRKLLPQKLRRFKTLSPRKPSLKKESTIKKLIKSKEWSKGRLRRRIQVRTKDS